MWVNDISTLNPLPPAKFRQWMQKPNNLANELRKVCNTLSVKLLSQHFDYALEDEYAALTIEKNFLDDSKICYIRKIFLEGDGCPFTYGRVVVPKTVYLHYQQKFDGLGTRLIGETLLYNDPTTRRSAFEYQRLENNHILFKEIFSYSSIITPLPLVSSLWARRSVFHMEGKHPLLITEVFLDSIPR